MQEQAYTTKQNEVWKRANKTIDMNGIVVVVVTVLKWKPNVNIRRAVCRVI